MDGVYVAAGDVNHDGNVDVVAGAGSSPNIRVFDGATSSLIDSFNAYASNFTGGVRVAAMDVNGDGIADIIAGAGPGGGPHMGVFDGIDLHERQSFFAYDLGFLGGIFVG